MKPGSYIAAGAYPGFCSMKRLELFILTLDGILIHRRSAHPQFVRFPQQACMSFISQARVVLYTGGKLVKELKFNAHGSDKLNWFSNPKLTYSSWINIKTEPNNVFSIAGLSERHFFINRSYGGCPHDYGWLAVTGWHCDWEKHYLPLKNVVIYCKSPSYTNWKNYSE